jgi:Protein of unknown function (DUF2795)
VFAEVAALQTLLEGAPLPAQKRDLVAYAREQPGGTAFVQMLERVPDGEYRSLDDVGEALLSVQPRAAKRAAAQPGEESDLPPGGDDYVNPEPESGAVRDDSPPDNPPQKAIQKQSETLKEQQSRQQEKLGG